MLSTSGLLAAKVISLVASGGQPGVPMADERDAHAGKPYDCGHRFAGRLLRDEAKEAILTRGGKATSSTKTVSKAVGVAIRQFS